MKNKQNKIQRNEKRKIKNQKSKKHETNQKPNGRTVKPHRSRDRKIRRRWRWRGHGAGGRAWDGGGRGRGRSAEGAEGTRTGDEDGGDRVDGRVTACDKKHTKHINVT